MNRHLTTGLSETFQMTCRELFPKIYRKLSQMRRTIVVMRSNTCAKEIRVIIALTQEAQRIVRVKISVGTIF